MVARVSRESGASDDLLRDLNPAQREAVTATEGPLLVLAGAGTGKTRVITYRIAHLLRSGVPPEAILAVTFTNKAAREMRERVASLVGAGADGLTVSTFHSLGAVMLRAEAAEAGLRPNFSIQDTADQLAVLRSVLRDIRGAVPAADVQAVLGRISRAKNRFLSPDDLVDSAQDDFEVLVARAYLRYDQALRAVNSADFDDLILLPVRMLERSGEVRRRYQERFRYVLVDEYQDTNGSQYRFTQALVGPERNVCVVGDDDQSIYGFRGAEVDKILRFEKDFPGARVVKLEENYRSAAPILRLANAVIASNLRRHPKELRSAAGEGPEVEWTLTADAESEVDFVVRRVVDLHERERLAFPQIAVLLRSALQARGFEEKLRLRRIPYQLVGGQSFFDRKEVRDALAYWKAAWNPSDDTSLLRIANTPRRGLGDTALKCLDELARAKKVPLQEALALAAAGDGGLGSRAREGAKGLAAALREARERIEAGEVAAACRWLLDEVAYRGAVEELYADPMAAQARWQAVEELLAWVQVWGERNRGEAFGSFLGLLALEVEGEGREDKRDDKRGVWLMTLHSAKGLEFPAVFIPGLEEEILPHRKSIDEGDAAIEEERRLLYVGITRARWLLFLSTALSRVAWGQARARIPSRFLTEIEDPGLLRRESYTMPCATAPEELKEILTRYKGARKQ